MKVVVTGARGFIARNLLCHLRERDGLELAMTGRDDSPDDLRAKLAGADVVYHLAGVNRPENDEEFATGNRDLSATIARTLAGQDRPAVLVLSSSTQAARDNPYGRSKLAAEQAVAEATAGSCVQSVIYRLPAVFGKWGKPHYNSVVATFCHQVSRGEHITVRDREFELNLTYVDDVCADLLRWLEHSPGAGECSQAVVSPVHRVTLGALADTLHEYRMRGETLRATDVADGFSKKLYSTYLSYLPTDRFSYPLTLRTDNRGDLFELIKGEKLGQIFISTTHPGITRGNHYHHTKTEKFVVIRGRGRIEFRMVDGTEVISYEVSGQAPTVVDIPPGYTHSITNTGDDELITLFWANEPFDAERPDTYALPVQP